MRLGNPTPRYLFGNDFGLNNTATHGICRDKSATYDVLTREDVPALEHRLLLQPGSLGAPEGVFSIAGQALRDFNSEAVCKPNNAGGGTDIYPVRSPGELEQALVVLFARHRAVTISPLVDIRGEYRICVLNDAVELVYEKVRAEGEFQHNLSHGAMAKIVTDPHFRETLSSLALRAARAVGGRFVHVDIIDVAGALMILEINAGIMFEHFSVQNAENRERATRIYHTALDALWADVL